MKTRCRRGAERYDTLPSINSRAAFALSMAVRKIGTDPAPAAAFIGFVRRQNPIVYSNRL
jgi:hypothetical protein